MSGAYVALYDALKKLKEKKAIEEIPIIEPVGAISVGMLKGEFLLDLDYDEDSTADVDANIVMTASGKIIEFQTTSEGKPFDQQDIMKFLELGQKGINEIIQLQEQVLKG
jgi:ribonuclease PH